MTPILTFLFLYFSLIHCYIEEPGPRFPATKGEIWPKPKTQIKSDNYFILRPSLFKITSNLQCTLLQDAIIRYELVISTDYGDFDKNLMYTRGFKEKEQILSEDSGFLGYIDELKVVLDGFCDDYGYPTINSTESYVIEINQDRKVLNSTSVWGILRGLESFYQSFYRTDDLLTVKINETWIDDSPRFPHRGLMLDTSRHFIQLNEIFLTIEAMAQNKFNVFHWHIVDDQSFPYVSKKFPEMSEKGAYSPYHIYTPAEIQTVIEYARLRGIRVIPEFDTPGHTRSWGQSHPELLTACQGIYEGKYGPIDPTKNETYTFMNELINEIKDVFVDEYIHLGGDEVGFECWQSNSNITKFMNAEGIFGYNGLESYYIQKIINIADRLDYKTVVWEEVFNNGVQIPNTTIVDVWQGSWKTTLNSVTSKGYEAILSACWYLGRVESGGDWEKYYSCEPYTFSDDLAKRKLLIGGEACMWSEVTDHNNLITRVWPRASATAEKLWSQQDDDDVDMIEVKRRLEEHACRMNRRGIGAQPPNGPGFCI